MPIIGCRRVTNWSVAIAFVSLFAIAIASSLSSVPSTSEAITTVDASCIDDDPCTFDRYAVDGECAHEPFRCDRSGECEHALSDAEMNLKCEAHHARVEFWKYAERAADEQRELRAMIEREITFRWMSTIGGAVIGALLVIAIASFCFVHIIPAYTEYHDEAHAEARELSAIRKLLPSSAQSQQSGTEKKNE